MQTKLFKQLKNIKNIKVIFSCAPDESAKLKKDISEHNLATRVDETFTGKYDLIRFEFGYFDLNKLIVISEYLGIYPNFPYFFVE